jgi:hypothetical protein
MIPPDDFQYQSGFGTLHAWQNVYMLHFLLPTQCLNDQRIEWADPPSAVQLTEKMGSPLLAAVLSRAHHQPVVLHAATGRLLSTAAEVFAVVVSL